MLTTRQHCQVCWDGGDLTLCSHCPRSYHYDCLDASSKVRSRTTMGFSCSQHQCWDCEQKTQDAGGMIFRCRWCERGFCEDCLDWDQTDLLGDNLKEFELLAFPSVTQAYYICCPSCTGRHATDATEKAFCDKQAKEIDGQYETMLEEQDAKIATVIAEQETPSDTQSLTDASTVESSAVATPYCVVDDRGASSKRKRKAAPASFMVDMLPLDDPDFAAAAYNSDSYTSSGKKRRKAMSGKDQFKASRRLNMLSSPLTGR